MTTLQEIFDRICDHAVTQNSVSSDEDGGCLYRHPDGRRCFVGVLISDEAYDPSIERRDVTTDAVADALQASGIDVRYWTKQRLRDLQGIHDSHEPSDWPAELRLFGEINGLAVPQCIQEPRQP